MKIYFVRHGKTLWNLEERFQGWADSPLLEDDDSPEKAARELEKLNVKFDYICSSDLKRAIDTKKRILKFLNIEYDNNEFMNFREVGFGEIEGENITKVKEKYAELWRNYKLQREDFDPGEQIKGFESIKAVKKRAFEKLDEIKEKYGDNANILIVSHGSFITIIRDRNKKLTEPSVVVENGSVTIVEY